MAEEILTNESETKTLDNAVIIEGLLYIVGEDGIRSSQLAEVMELDLEVVEAALADIENKYSSDEYAVELVNFGGIYKFLSKKEIFPYAQRLFQTAKANSLSQSALETLAIIAYKQPVTRVEIEELRGVGCDMMLRKLQARNLIKEAGRSEAPGRPILYEVTDEFMDSFKLLSLDELPELPEFKSDENADLFE